MDQYMLVLDAHEDRNPAFQPHANRSLGVPGLAKPFAGVAEGIRPVCPVRRTRARTYLCSYG
jgi:hypothetical protein